jgi:YggT family protein
MTLAILQLIFDFLNLVLNFLLGCILVWVVASWLVAFNIINPRNQVVLQILRLLDRIINPIMAPFRRFIPLIGGIDISPLIVGFLIRETQQLLLPRLFVYLAQSIG